MNKCPIHDLPLQTRHTKQAPFRKYYRCPETENNQCSYTAWVDEPPSSSAPLSQGSNMPLTPGSQANPSSQSYPEPPSTPIPAKRNFSAIDDDDYQKKVLGSQKRLRIIQDTLAEAAGSSPEQKTPSGSSQTSKFKPAVDIPSIKFNIPSHNGGNGSKPPPPSTPPRRSEAIGPSIDESPSVFGGHHMPAQGRNGSLATVHETPQDETSDTVAETVADMIRRLETLPDYIRKFEGRKIAAEKSRDAKNSKMISLQNQVNSLELEVERLKAREKELEEVIAAYEQN